MFYRHLLAEIGLLPAGPTPVKSDNLDAVRMVLERGYKPKLRHVDVRYQYAQERSEAGDVIVDWVPTHTMLADIFAKNVDVQQFLLLCGTILVSP